MHNFAETLHNFAWHFHPFIGILYRIPLCFLIILPDMGLIFLIFSDKATEELP